MSGCGRETDGIWVKYWYGAVETSTSFEPYRPKSLAVPRRLRGLYQQCRDHYRALHEHRLGR